MLFKGPQILEELMDAVFFSNVVVVGLARVDAPLSMTTDEVEARLSGAMARANFSPGLLYQLTGIWERRLWEPGVMPSDGATEAGRAVIEESGVDRGQIGVLISTSVSKDFVEPSVASLVHKNLGLGSRCLSFDVANACLGFLNGVHIVGDMIERGHVDYGLVVNGESSREVLEATIERFNRPDYDLQKMRSELATLTLGSGAAAMLLGRRDRHEGSPQVVGAVTRSATEHNDLCRGQRDWMETNAAMLLVRGVELGAKTFEAAKRYLGWSSEDLDHIAAHQVSAVHMARMAERLGMERERFAQIYKHYGNVGPASIPIALSQMMDRGRIRPGDRVGLMGIGSGLNCSMMEIRF